MPSSFTNYTETTDAAASTATAYTIGVGDTFVGEIDSLGADQDWIAITLVAGTSYRIAQTGATSGGGTLADTVLELLNNTGAQVAINDDGGAGFESLINFTATTTGAYYINAGSYGTQVGTYSVAVTEQIPAPVGTYTELAAYLTDGFWTDVGGSRHAFDTSGSNTITVNLTGLAADGMQLARWALEAWELVADINFVETTGVADITFDDTSSGAFSNYVSSGSTIISATVNVSTAWVASYGTTMDSYSFQTFTHEIGHALGLGHQGNYNGSATYGLDNTFANDSWQVSIMSYFDQTDNTTVNASYAYVQTAMMADIIAIQDLYGAAGASSATAGDTTYGANSNIGGYLGDLFSALNGGPTAGIYGGAAVAMTIYDLSGIDTVDMRNSTTSDNVNMAGGTFSDISGLIGNVGIAVGTIIENYISGSGNDTIRGNGAANHISGNGGDDTILGLAGNDFLRGGNGIDTLRGGSGADVLHGDNDNDRLYGSNDNDRLYGGSGGDRMYGDDGGDRLYGNTGHDRLWGGNGHDRLWGGSGNDMLWGGSGNDRLWGGSGHDRLRGGSGNDIVRGNEGADEIYGEEGNDRLYGDTGNDILRGGDGVDRMFGNDDNDSLFGEDGNDHIFGGEGNDRLYGGAGNDILDGGTGVDLIIGGIGDDTMTGGQHRDTFVFRDNHGDDTITDFDISIDTIKFKGTALNFSALTITYSGGDALIDYGTGSIVLDGVASGLSASDFDFA